MEIPDHLPSILNKAELRRIPKNKLLKLRKALYGLKQSGRQWLAKLDEKLKSMCFKQLGADNCVYTLEKENDITIIVIYVDDIIIAASDIKKMKRIKKDVHFRNEGRWKNSPLPRNPIHSDQRHHHYGPKEIHRGSTRKIQHGRLQGSDNSNQHIRNCLKKCAPEMTARREEMKDTIPEFDRVAYILQYQRVLI